MTEEIDQETLRQLREKARPNTKWAAFQNVALDSSLRGHIQFLMFGDGCTYPTRPEKMPDTAFDTGWKYVFAGVVNLKTGKIEREENSA